MNPLKLKKRSIEQRGAGAMLMFALVMVLGVGLAAAAGGCGDDNGGGGEDGGQDGGGVTDGTIQMDVTYPAGAVTQGYRPSIAVYRASDYDDFSSRPAAMPIAALLGEEGANELSGAIMDLGQTEAYVFEPGDYSVVVGVAEATGMPSHVDGTPWYPIAVTIDTEGVVLQVTADDNDWRSQ